MSGEGVPAVKRGRRSLARIRRDRNVTRLAQALARQAPWLMNLDGPMLKAFAQMERLSLEMYSRIKDEGLFRPDGAPHRALDKFTRLRQVQMGLADRLGLTPRGRAEMEGSATANTIDLTEVEERLAKVKRQRYGDVDEPNGSTN
jgi:hypothetical protein